MNSIAGKFHDIKNKEYDQAIVYENKESYEMVYIAYWTILEKTLKLLDVELRRKVLYENLCSWKDWMENKSGKKPKEIKSFNIGVSEKIPDVIQIEKPTASECGWILKYPK